MSQDNSSDEYEDDVCTEEPCYRFDAKDSIMLSKVFTPCDKKKCERYMKCHLPPLKQILTAEEEEMREVQALPSKWVSEPKPSKVITDLMARKLKRNEEIKQEVTEQCRSLNRDIEAQIRLKSEILKMELRQSKSNIDELVNSLQLPPKTVTLMTFLHDCITLKQLGELTEADFEGVLNDINETLNAKKVTIKKYYCFLQDLEKERMEKYKKVLKYEYSELHKLSYELPYQLQIYFENKILNINQIVLNNLRCYADLQQNLLLQVHDNVRLSIQQFEKSRSLWKNIKKKEMLMKLNEMMLNQSDPGASILRSNLGQSTSSKFLRKEHDLEKITLLKSSLPLRTSQVELWSNHADEVLYSLDSCARKLITLYKMAIVQVFQGYFVELENVEDQMRRVSWIDSDELDLLNFEVCKPTLDSVTRQYSTDLFRVKDEWESVITRLQNKLKHTGVFLRQVGSVWDAHFDRLENLKQIVLRDLRGLITKNDKWQNVQEMELIIATDNLRQSHSENHLDNQLKDAFKKIDVMQNIYRAHFNSEMKTLEKYEELVELESELLLAELQQIIHLFPKPPIKRANYSETSRTSMITPTENEDEEKDTFKSFLFKRTNQLEFQIEAVENWMTGLQESIAICIETCQVENQKLAKSWISENTKKLAKRLDIKLAVNNSKYERIKYSVYKVRLSELKMHNDRINRHKAGAEEELAKVKTHFLSVQMRCQTLLSENKMCTQRVLTKMENISSSSKIRNLIRMVHYNTKQCNQKMSDLFTKMDDLLMVKMAKIRDCSKDFCEKMKLFYEGGNFTAEEVKHICKDLKKFEKVLKKKSNAIKKEIKKKQNTALNEIKKDEVKTLPTLTHSLEEFLFGDMIATMIQNVTVDLKDETYKLKFYMKKCEDRLECVIEKGKDHFGEAEHLQFFEDECKFLFEEFLDVTAMLYHTPPENTVRKLVYPHIHNASAGSSKNESKKSEKSSKSNLSGFYDYAQLLFENEPTDPDSFMSSICMHLLESIKSIQNEAQEFYSKHPKILNKKWIQPSYDEIMRDILEKYNFYFIQCELLWLQTVNDCFKIIELLHEVCTKYFSSFLELHHKNGMRSKKALRKEFMDSLLEVVQEHADDLQSIRKKLKPLHGYKYNKHLLDNLILEMETALHNCKIMDFHGNFIVPYQEMLRNDLNRYMTERNTIETVMGNLKKNELLLLNQPLLSQFDERIKRFEYFLETMKSDSENCTLEIDKAFYEKLQYLEIPSEFNLKADTLHDIQRSNNFLENGKSMDLDDYIEIYREQCKLNLNELRNIELYWAFQIDKEEKKFKNDVVMVCRLYFVKYDKEN